jgi:hypothetical protein
MSTLQWFEYLGILGAVTLVGCIGLFWCPSGVYWLWMGWQDAKRRRSWQQFAYATGIAGALPVLFLVAQFCFVFLLVLETEVLVRIGSVGLGLEILPPIPMGTVLGATMLGRLFHAAMRFL